MTAWIILGLVVANIPLYVVVGRWLFGSWEDFADSIHYCLVPGLALWMTDDFGRSPLSPGQGKRPVARRHPGRLRRIRAHRLAVPRLSRVGKADGWRALTPPRGE